MKNSIHVVIFTGGFYPRPWDTESYWNHSLKPDFIIAADSGLDVCLEFKKYFSGKLDFSPDRILGDFDSVSSKNLLSEFSDDIVRTFSRDKDFTDTELALRAACCFAKEKKAQPFITLVGGDGGRADHFLNIVDSFRSDFHPDVWLCASQQICCLKKGSEYCLFGLGLDDNVSVANVFGKGNRIETKGFLWESNLFAKKNMPSISNRIAPEVLKKGEPVLLKPKAMGFLLIFPLHAILVRNSQDIRNDMKPEKI